MTLTETLTETRVTPGVFLRHRLFLQYVLSGGAIIVGLILYAMAQHNAALDMQLPLSPDYPFSRWNVLLLPAGVTLTVVGLLWLAVLCLTEYERHRDTPGMSLPYVRGSVTFIAGVVLSNMAFHYQIFNQAGSDLVPTSVFMLPVYALVGHLLPSGEAMAAIGVLWMAADCIIETGLLPAEYFTEHRRHKANPAAGQRPHFGLEQLTPDTIICTSVNAHTFVVVETTRDEHHPSVAQAFDLAGAHLRSEPRELLVNIKGPAPRDSAQVRVSDTSSGTLTVVYGTLRDVQAELQHQDLLLVAQEKAAAQQRADARKRAGAATNRFRLKR